MTLLSLTLQPGRAIVEQVVFAAIKAFVSGDFVPGQAFPSVRALAADLKIHPNTAHKVVQQLIQEGWLEVLSGRGTVVAPTPAAHVDARRQLIEQECEQLVVQAKRIGVELADLLDIVNSQWQQLDRTLGKSRS